jgi:hypothetical protein
MMIALLLLLFQSGADALFTEAADHLTQKRYVEAATVLNQLDGLGEENGPMLINLGIAYAQLDSLGLAKFHFTRAAAYPEVGDQSEAGLTYVTQQLQRRASGLPVLALNRIQNSILSRFDPFWSLLIPILLLNAGALVLVWHFRVANRWRKIAAIVILSASGLGFIHHMALSVFTARYDLGVMIRQETPLRETPSPDAPAILPVFEGYDLRIDRSQASEGWVHVTLINGSNGWLPAGSVRTYPSNARP